MSKNRGPRYFSKYDVLVIYRPRKFFRDQTVLSVYGKRSMAGEIIEWSYHQDPKKLSRLYVYDRLSGDRTPALEYVDRLHKQQDRDELERTLKGRELAIYRLEKERRG